MPEQVTHRIAVLKPVESAHHNVATSGIGGNFGLAQLLCQPVERSQ